MVEVEYPNGPWKKLFYGQYDGYDLSIYFNQDGFILSEILNAEKTKSVFNTAQILGLFGDGETFVETLPRNTIFLLQHGKSNEKYVLILGDQQVLNYQQKDISDYINDQYKKLNKDSKSLINIANSYDINLKLYSELTSDMRNNIFSNPLNLFSFITQNRKPIEYVSQKETTKKDLFLGFFKTTNEKSVEPIDLFKRTFLFGSAPKTLKIILEDLSMNKINSVIFTYSDEYNNLKYPNESKDVQEKNNGAPIGFPVVNYSVGEKICVNLQDLPKDSFCELFNISTVSKELISLVLTEKKSLTLDALINDVSNYLPNDTFNFYNIQLTSRILNNIKQEYPGIFIGDFSVSDFSKDSGKSFGTINIITLPKDNLIISKLIIYNTIKKIIELNSNIAIVLPNIQKYFLRNTTDILTSNFVDLILKDKNNLYVFNPANEIDLDNKLLSQYTAKLSILENDEIALTIKDAKPFRFILRPSFSK